MTPSNIITELFLYFAKFPNRKGVFPMFNAVESSMPGYNKMTRAVHDLPEHSLTGIQYYVFGANIEAVGYRVNNIPAGSDYLFVDFGEVDCDTDRVNRMTDSVSLAITVAYRLKSFSADLIEQALAFAHSLDSLVWIRNKMIDEQREHRWLKKISDKHTFVPFVGEQFSSIGWTLMFNREGYDSFTAKTP